jgi:hypothetical protein
MLVHNGHVFPAQLEQARCQVLCRRLGHHLAHALAACKADEVPPLRQERLCLWYAALHHSDCLRVQVLWEKLLDQRARQRTGLGGLDEHTVACARAHARAGWCHLQVSTL